MYGSMCRQCKHYKEAQLTIGGEYGSWLDPIAFGVGSGIYWTTSRRNLDGV